MKNELLDKVNQELDRWRTRMGELRVRAKLGEMDLRDRHPEVFEEFESAFRSAGESLHSLKETGDSAFRGMIEGAEAGWEELRSSFEKRTPDA